MITILDCIKRIPAICDHIINSYENIFEDLKDYVKDKKINELIFIGSGTSNTSSITAHDFVEKVTEMRVSHYLPNEFLNKTYFNDQALYIFVSQSGTSTLTNQALEKIKEKQFYNACICADSTSRMVGLSDCLINLSCGYEEYGMRTIGYVSSVLIEMLTGLCIATSFKIINNEQLKNHLEDARKSIDGIKEMTASANTWYEQHHLKLMDAEGVILYGGKGLWGVALEGALKILEITRNTLAIGYEIDDGCHGPTMGFTKKHAVIVMNIDDHNNKTATNLSNFAKGELGFGCLVGFNTNSETDLSFVPHSKEFYCIEFAPFVQVLAYRLAIDKKTVLKPTKLMEPLSEKKYFNMHEK